MLIGFLLFPICDHQHSNKLSLFKFLATLVTASFPVGEIEMANKLRNQASFRHYGHFQASTPHVPRTASTMCPFMATSTVGEMKQRTPQLVD